MIVTKNLNGLNQAIILKLSEVPEERNGAASIQYGLNAAGNPGTGTIVMEVSNDGTNWVGPILITNPVTKTDALSIAAAGIAYAEMTGYEFVRARMSVAGDVNVSLCVRVG